MNKKFIVPALVDKSDELEVLDGLLFRLPPDLSGIAKIRSYASQSKIGWHKIDFGYWMYIHSSEELGLIRFIGLSPNDSRPLKDLGIKHPFSKQDFQRYVDSLVEGERHMRDRVKEEISLLIHDLRRFSNSIYQNAVATKKAIFDGEATEAATRIENTLAAQAMLSIRTDILDMTESRDLQLDETRVPVYRKFDKVVKSFQPGCKLKGIDLYISGSSHSMVLGPDCMEIIAYILVDNALKYSPSNHKIRVKVEERNNEIIIDVISIGPIIEMDEIDIIFDKGFRSKAARAVETNGTGFGLYLAKSLVERFKGSISAEQFGEEIKTNRRVYRDTSFKVIFPISEKLDRPIHLHLDRKGPPKQLPLIKPEGKKLLKKDDAGKAILENKNIDTKAKSRRRFYKKPVSN